MKRALLIGFLGIATLTGLSAGDTTDETTDYAIKKAIKSNNPEELRFVFQRPFTNEMDATFTKEKKGAYLALAQSSIKNITDKTLHTKELMDKTQEVITLFLSMSMINEWVTKAIKKEEDISEELKKKTQEFNKKAQDSTRILFEGVKQQAPGALKKAQEILEKAQTRTGALSKVPDVLIDIYHEQINKLHDLATHLSRSYECLSIVKNMKTSASSPVIKAEESTKKTIIETKPAVIEPTEKKSEENTPKEMISEKA